MTNEENVANDVQSAKEKLQNLMKEKDALEDEIKRLVDFLKAPGNPGLKGGLIDKDGFPVGDLDKVLSVRQARNNLAHKQNDHINLMKSIEESLYHYHSLAKQNQTENQNTSKVDENIQNNPFSHLKPFARVNAVSAGSPAYESELRVDDLILQFGSVNHSNHRNLLAIKDVVMNSINTPIPLTLKRNSDILSLHITPHTWSGQGLLGCHLLPYQ